LKRLKEDYGKNVVTFENLKQLNLNEKEQFEKELKTIIVRQEVA